MSKEYIQIAFDFENQDQLEILVAQLSNLGFDGFNEEEAATSINNGVGMSSVLGTSAGLGEGAGHCKTFILQQDYMANNIEDKLNNIFSLHNLKYSKSIIKEENWNAVWESNFEPVRVGDFVGIRANFHPSFDPKVQYEIQITPKMSFGTGHHATTFTVMQLMENLDFRGKSVYDFGTGTGILAILAEMLGASEVLAVDNDPWCIENSEENLQANDSSKITIQLVDAAFQPRDFDIIIANVNRHIIEANLEALTQVSNSNSTLILSGLLIEDQDDIISLAQKNNWQFIQSQPLDGWVSLLFNKA
ncbi:MAG: 50S ribosomal protein L11 methyltransferase [Sediminibacterium sp.]|jgi:ribosomal protein L11 methyltransferase|nr:50S ribosomal protein L11 methyltransferase [Sediminibacterium sp.]